VLEGFGKRVGVSFSRKLECYDTENENVFSCGCHWDRSCRVFVMAFDLYPRMTVLLNY
jgi:hypothetical protein